MSSETIKVRYDCASGAFQLYRRNPGSKRGEWVNSPYRNFDALVKRLADDGLKAEFIGEH